MSRGVRKFEHFWEVGEIWVDKLDRLLAKQGAALADMEAILDFGCGCGRVIRHLPEGPRLVGTDYNPELIGWCREHLPFEFTQNRSEPPLPFPDETFDFVYALSVFTHQRPELQRPWMAELERITRSGGFLLISVFDATQAEIDLSGQDLAQFRSGELVVFGADKPGQNECSAYHADVRDLTDLDLQVYEPSPPGRQDAALFLR